MDENLTVNSIVGVVYLAVIVLYVVGLWKMYVKTGKPGWASIVPFYNIYVLLKIVGRPGWWLVLFLVPVVNIVITIIIALDLANPPTPEYLLQTLHQAAHQPLLLNFPRLKISS